jgi:fibrillarin-like rRNA methylase
VAKLFLEPSNYIAIAFIKGHSAVEANNRSKECFKKNIKKLMTSDTLKEDRELIPYLLWDMDHQICIGNDKAVL